MASPLPKQVGSATLLLVGLMPPPFDRARASQKAPPTANGVYFSLDRDHKCLDALHHIPGLATMYYYLQLT